VTPPIREVTADEDEAEQLSPRVVHNHYSQSKLSNGNGDKLNTVLLACLLAIMGFIGIQVWIMNGRMGAFEATLTLLVQRSGIATPAP
jgi:hypothetical protein